MYVLTLSLKRQTTLIILNVAERSMDIEHLLHVDVFKDEIKVG